MKTLNLLVKTGNYEPDTHHKTPNKKTWEDDTDRPTKPGYGLQISG